jgi:hypothetical protein
MRIRRRDFHRRKALSALFAGVTGAVALGISPVNAASLQMGGGAFPASQYFLTPQQFGYGTAGYTTAQNTAAIQACFNAAFGPASAPNGSNTAANIPVYFPPGNYVTSSALILRSVSGSVISGAGQLSTSITNASGGSVIVTNGFSYNTIRDISFNVGNGNTSDVVFDLDWDNTGNVSLNDNTFINVGFGNGAIGLRIGNSGYMGSEGYYLNCTFSACGTAGMKTCNANALNQFVFGANAVDCANSVAFGSGAAYWCYLGSIKIFGGSLSGNNLDIMCSTNATFGVSQARTESANFIYGAGTVAVDGCFQDNATSGIFVQINGHVTISACDSQNGIVDGQISGTISGTRFGASSWLGNHYYQNRRLTIDAGCSYNYSVSETPLGPKVITDQGASWVTSRYYVTIPSGSASVSFQIGGANQNYFPARIVAVSLILDTAGSGGTVNVGDNESATRYFSAQSLTGGNAVSAVTNYLYSSSDNIIVATTGAVAVTGTIAIDLQLLT